MAAVASHEQVDSELERYMMNEMAPIATRVIHEDDASRVWLLELQPGEATEWHVHHCDYVYVVTAATRVETEYLDGSIEAQNDQLGATSYRHPDAGHRLVNRGHSVYRNIVVELKR